MTEYELLVLETLARLEAKMDRVEESVRALHRRTTMIDQALANLQAAQAAEDVQIGLIGPAITSLSERILAALAAAGTAESNDPALVALTTDVTTQTTALTAIGAALAGLAPAPPVVEPTLTPTTTTATADNQTPTAGSNVVLTFVVDEDPTGAVPTGSLNLTDSGTPVAGFSLDATGAATFTVDAIAAGTHVYVATYNGDSANAGSVSNSLTVVAN